jgi:hypothetical protein
MQSRLWAAALVFASALSAQPERKPQMIWQGEVDETALLYVRGKRLEVETKGGAPVAKQRYRIYDPLPDTRQDVRLTVSEGRGNVRIVEQPHADNRFTLALSIEDKQAGSAFYSIALYWDTGDMYDRKPGGADHITWSGRVDQEVIVTCHGNQCTSEAVSGAPPMHERVKVSRPLPERDVKVSLETVEGRGEVRLVEQPGEHNGYTARVRIRDPQGGAGDYSFVLSWARQGRPDTQSLAPLIGLVWSGRVEGTIRVTVQGGAAFSKVINGRPVVGENTHFDRPLPARSDLTPVIKKRQGRGSVEIIEVPNKGNGYQLVFEVRDDGGSDFYEVEVAW